MMSNPITQEQKELIILHHREHKDDKEIAKLLNISQYTVGKITSNYWSEKMLKKDE